jgi:tetratricopeptide (TPR) repeat protein
LSWQYRHDETKAAIRRAIALQPTRPEFSYIQAETLAAAGRIDEAFVVFDEAINCEPNFENTIFHHTILAYDCGRFEDGARDYRKRLTARDNENCMGDDRLPENLKRQLIVMEGDQGLSDEIHFLRFMAEIRKRGAQTRYIADPTLVQMLMRAATTTDEVIAKGSIQTNSEATHLCVGDFPHAIGLKDDDILPPTIDIPPAPHRLTVI